MAHGESDVLMLMQQQQQQQFMDPYYYFQDYAANMSPPPNPQMDANLLAECEFDVNFIADLEGGDMLSALPMIEPPPKLAMENSYAMPTFGPLFVPEELDSLTLVGGAAKPSPPESPQPKMEDSKEGILSWGEMRRNSFPMHRSMSSHALGQFGPCSSPNSNSSSSNSSSSSTPSIPSSALDSAMQGLTTFVPSSFFDCRGDTMMHSLVDAKPTTSGSIRRVCSTGDIQRMNEAQDTEGGKIGRYNMAERKERIHRYRQKRSERNFNKKIKYACRKTLADSRPRVRGRFAKNEEVPDSTTPTSTSTSTIPSPIPETGATFGAAFANIGGGSFRTSHEYDEEVEDEGFLIDSQSSGELSEFWGVPSIGGGAPR